MAGRKIRDAVEARACLRMMSVSGVPPAVWARREGIDGRSLNAWRLNLARAGSGTTTPPRLVELVPAEAPSQPHYVVRCGDLAVEVGEGFDERTLLRLLRVVTAC